MWSKGPCVVRTIRVPHGTNDKESNDDLSIFAMTDQHLYILHTHKVYIYIDDDVSDGGI